MSEDRVSASLPATDHEAAIATIKNKLPFLIDIYITLIHYQEYYLYDRERISSTIREKSLTVPDQTAIARQNNSTIREKSSTVEDIL